MAKPTKTATKTTPKMNLLPGTQVACPMLIVDQSGAAWWIDPNDRSITKAS